MLPIAPTPGSTSPSGVVDGLAVRHAVRTFPCGSALRWVSPPATLPCDFALRLVSPTTMASADFWPVRSRHISPGKGTMLPCTTTAFTSTGKPDDFAVLCQLVVPCRPSMRFLSIGSRFSPSLPSHGRWPFRAWPLVVVSSFSCLVFLQGTCTPFASCPCRAHTSRCPVARATGGIGRRFRSACGKRVSRVPEAGIRQASRAIHWHSPRKRHADRRGFNPSAGQSVTCHWPSQARQRSTACICGPPPAAAAP
jgi:hypothetical protein